MQKVDNIKKAVRLADLDGINVLEVDIYDLLMLVNELTDKDVTITNLRYQITKLNLEVSKCIVENIEANSGVPLGLYLDKHS